MGEESTTNKQEGPNKCVKGGKSSLNKWMGMAIYLGPKSTFVDEIVYTYLPNIM